MSEQRKPKPSGTNAPATACEHGKRSRELCKACAGTGEDYNEGDQGDRCHMCGGKGVITAVDDQMSEAVATIEALMKHIELNECQHENTHRGGLIWTVCDDCGHKWADDRGGFKSYKQPEAITKAEEFLAALAKSKKENK